MPVLRIKIEREGRDWSLEYLGKLVGITKQSMSAIERGASHPSYKVLCKLERIFGKPHGELLEPVDDAGRQRTG